MILVIIWYKKWIQWYTANKKQLRLYSLKGWHWISWKKRVSGFFIFFSGDGTLFILFCSPMWFWCQLCGISHVILVSHGWKSWSSCCPPVLGHDICISMLWRLVWSYISYHTLHHTHTHILYILYIYIYVCVAHSMPISGIWSFEIILGELWFAIMWQKKPMA